MPAKRLLGLIGKIVTCHWDDAHSEGRMFGPDSSMQMAELVTYGVVSHVDDRRITIRQEEDESVDCGSDAEKMKEPVQIPLGCITRIVPHRPLPAIVLRAFGPASRKKPSKTVSGISWVSISRKSYRSRTGKKLPR